MRTFILACAALGVSTSLAFAQLEGMGNGSHNTPEDLANSLKPIGPKRGKEKSEQIDPSKLHSNAIKNTTFEGSLLDSGTGQSVKFDTKNLSSGKEKSARTSGANETSATAKTADTSGDKEKASKPGNATADGQTPKKEKQTSNTTGKPEDKATAPKNDGS